MDKRLLSMTLAGAVLWFCPVAGEAASGRDFAADSWISRLLGFPYQEALEPGLRLQLFRQDYEQLERNLSILKTPLTIGSRRFTHGLGTHAVSHLRLLSPEPVERFTAWIGVDHNNRTQGGLGSVIFFLTVNGRELYRSTTLRGGAEPARVELELSGATNLDLQVSEAGDGPACDHADWAEAAVTLRSGKTIRLDELAVSTAPWRGSRYPFSFNCDGKFSDELLPRWRSESGRTEAAPGPPIDWQTWTDPDTGLRVVWEARRFADFPALEWILHFENTGTRDTPILENIEALDLTLGAPLSREQPYRLHRSKGAPANPTDFEPALMPIAGKQTERLGGGGGRSSNRDFPFFKIESGEGSLVVAVGWSGQWQARAHSPDGHHLRLTAGMELTHFKLHPGEQMRSPRMLVLYYDGDTLEANAQFRQLIYRHYAATRAGRKPLPTLFCNTCFTRGGGWLNECNASNQISLIRAYAPLGLEALITDAGWFEGGWPAGAGNWTPRRDAYPQGIAPVAAAARENNMVYGLWFEPERVIAGTELHRKHPDWVLTDGTPGQTTLLANFGLREVQDYFFNVVEGFMDLSGFRFYRQDFNMDPLAYWRHNDPPDRQGLTEIRYVEGLYAYWDRLAAAWPDSLREECASGGRRIDLETVRRMHLHQKSDYWFDNEVDQASLWTLSHYLPNHVVTVPLTRLDDYSFHSTLASSLIPAWIADAPDFDLAQARQLLERYRSVRHLLVGAWYPLLPYSRSLRDWIAMQFHRPDLGEGMVLAFRRPESPYPSLELSLHGLDPAAFYELSFHSSGEERRVSGADLMQKLLLTLPGKRQSELMRYRRRAE
jgi:alpha-galactosidase